MKQKWVLPMALKDLQWARNESGNVSLSNTEFQIMARYIAIKFDWNIRSLLYSLHI